MANTRNVNRFEFGTPWTANCDCCGNDVPVASATTKLPVVEGLSCCVACELIRRECVRTGTWDIEEPEVAEPKAREVPIAMLSSYGIAVAVV